jgi:hypothetical protein
MESRLLEKEDYVQLPDHLKPGDLSKDQRKSISAAANEGTGALISSFQ